MHPIKLLAITPLLLAAPADQDEMGWTGVLDEAAFAALHELTEDEAPELVGEDVEVAGAQCYLSRPQGVEPLGAVIVIHEWWGLNDHVKHWTDRLAADGYVALAVDLYGGEVAATREDAMRLMRAVEDDAALATMKGVHEWLTDPGGDVAAERTGVIGWCFGGGRSLQLAIGESDLDAAVVYYGRLVTDAEQLAKIEAPMLGIFGEQDSGIPPEAVEEFAKAMRAAGNELEVHSYDAPHAFANPSSGRYDAESAAAAWLETRAFLCRELWPESPDGLLARGTRDLEGEAPDGWEQGRESSMRIASWTALGTCDVSVIPLGGNGGGVRANLDRWASQVGEEALSDDEFDALPRVPVMGRLAPIYYAEGSFTDMSGVEMANGAVLGIFVELEDEALSMKLSGPREDVDAAARDFLNYCRSLR